MFCNHFSGSIYQSNLRQLWFMQNKIARVIAGVKLRGTLCPYMNTCKTGWFWTRVWLGTNQINFLFSYYTLPQHHHANIFNIKVIQNLLLQKGGMGNSTIHNKYFVHELFVMRVDIGVFIIVNVLSPQPGTHILPSKILCHFNQSLS